MEHIEKLFVPIWIPPFSSISCRDWMIMVLWKVSFLWSQVYSSACWGRKSTVPTLLKSDIIWEGKERHLGWLIRKLKSLFSPCKFIFRVGWRIISKSYMDNNYFSSHLFCFNLYFKGSFDLRVNNPMIILSCIWLGVFVIPEIIYSIICIIMMGYVIPYICWDIQSHGIIVYPIPHAKQPQIFILRAL